MGTRGATAVLTALMLGATAAVTAAVPVQAAAAGCAVTYRVGGQWSGGFTADVTVTNLGAPVTAWTLTWSYTSGQRVTQAWNATVTQAGAQVTARNAAWNGGLATGGSTSFGLTGSFGATNPAPTGFALNGTSCGGDDPGDPGDPGGPSGVLAQAHTAGRVVTAGQTVQYSWPGIYFEGRFRGTGVGLVFDDAVNDYDVAVDGRVVATLVKPGTTTRWVDGLAAGEHTVRLVKRTESPWSASAFGGLVAASGGVVLDPPAARSRQVEFIGDSLTVGYGNTSGTRDCTGDQVTRTTNTDLSFGALTARELDADYQVNAYSGIGMVRNYNGGSPGVNYGTYYDRALLHVDGDVWDRPATWRPQLVVVDLGTNDFSTPINSGEPWTEASLAAAYRATYVAFLEKLRARYGAGTTIVVVGTSLFGDKAQQVVRDRNAAGDARVRYWYLDDAGLDLLGCHWHYSAADDRLIADRLGDYVATLGLGW
ncbi:cellulose binding domain-containing protein [Micromonospora haikouensis]|uniref:cellulose binding domain-containing protein n=1 Tax=Micromonospora haikouensis TaxID=686309 RepID=UPI0037AA7A37